MLDDKKISGALFDFLGYLTTRDEATSFGACEDAAPAVKLLEAWVATRRLSLDDPDIANWDGRKIDA